MVAKNVMESRGLVVFDLDGTLLRGPTVCELLAAPLGRSDEMRVFESVRTEEEIAQARVEMARWYGGIPREHLLESLATAQWAPRAFDGVALLRDAGIEVAIASITWTFGVEYFAARLGVSRTLGTGLRQMGQLTMLGLGIRRPGYEPFPQNWPCPASGRPLSVTLCSAWSLVPYRPVPQHALQVQTHVHVELLFLVAAPIDRHPANEARVVPPPEALGEPRSALVEADDVHGLGSWLPVPVRLVLQHRNPAVEATSAGLPNHGILRKPALEDKLVVAAGSGAMSGGCRAGRRVRAGALPVARRAGPVVHDARQCSRE